MSRRQAPTAWRRPISRVRSVTETSMMFMMLMPPTTRDTDATAARNKVTERAAAACAALANDLMALSRERIADEWLKLLTLADPAPTIALMLSHGILLPVLPEVEAGALPLLVALIEAERSAALPAEPLRRWSSFGAGEGSSADPSGCAAPFWPPPIFRKELTVSADTARPNSQPWP